MLTLRVQSYKNSKIVVLSLIGEGTKIITQVYENHTDHVANYIKHYEPNKVIYSNSEFENTVGTLLHK